MDRSVFCWASLILILAFLGLWIVGWVGDLALVRAPPGAFGWVAFTCLLVAAVAVFLSMRSAARRQAEIMRLRADLDLLRSEAHADEVAQAELLARLAHEMRTPVHGILGLADWLEPRTAGVNRRRLRILQSSAQQLRALVDDALDLARLESGRLPLREEPFSPRRLFDETLAIVSHQAESKGLDLRLEVGPEVPATLRGDPLRLRQICLNLLSNAVKYTRAGWVEARLDYEAGHLACEVEDTGVGISEADQERLFRPFQRADTTMARSVEGAGLGLSICRHLVREMAGCLECRSERDHRGADGGSTFSFRVPMPVAEMDRAPDDSTLDASVFRDRRILVVDDDAIHRLVVACHLEDLGARVLRSEGGATALEQMVDVDFAIDAVIVDLHMPEIDGPESIRKLLTAWPDERPRPVIVAVTAEATVEATQRCHEAGADSILAKPFRKRDLVDHLRAVRREMPTEGQPRNPEDRGGEVSVPVSLAGSETLAALWRHGRRTGRDELSRAIEGLESAGDKALADVRLAVAEERYEDAATCAHGLAGLAAVLGCSSLEARCRDVSSGGEVRIEELRRELEEAVAELRRLWPGGAVK